MGCQIFNRIEVPYDGFEHTEEKVLWGMSTCVRGVVGVRGAEGSTGGNQGPCSDNGKLRGVSSGSCVMQNE